MIGDSPATYISFEGTVFVYKGRKEDVHLKDYF